MVRMITFMLHVFYNKKNWGEKNIQWPASHCLHNGAHTLCLPSMAHDPSQSLSWLQTGNQQAVQSAGALLFRLPL